MGDICIDSSHLLVPVLLIGCLSICIDSAAASAAFKTPAGSVEIKSSNVKKQGDQEDQHLFPAFVACFLLENSLENQAIVCKGMNDQPSPEALFSERVQLLWASASGDRFWDKKKEMSGKTNTAGKFMVDSVGSIFV